MKCPRCRFETPSDAEFCPECGAKLVLACAQCGTANAPGHKFCKKCGQPLASAAQTPIGTRFAAPQAYTPKHLAEKILTFRSALEGERKQVTVLFADLKGSMELLADRDPEDARKLLDPVLERMMEAVHRYEGTVNQVMGDGVMALFGAPLAHEDHAVRACYAALRMQEAIRRYSEDLRRAHGVEVQIRVGLNSGEVVVRSIGSDLHMDYTAVGQTTHLAARMEQLATPGSIRLSAETLRLAEGYVAVRPLGPVPVKGLPEPVEVYELSGAGLARTRLQAAAARGLTRFVGREAEMETLRRAIERAAQGHGQVVTVVGEPGVGKSRLFWEFTHSHRTHGWLILESGSVSYGKATPYLPVTDLLKNYFQLEARDDIRKIREKVTGKLLALDETLKPTLAAFLALLDVAVDDPQWQALDPLQRRQQTLDAVKRLLLRESRVQPLLVVFEDLHWIDSETQALLDGLVESLPTTPVLLLVNYRPEYQHGWGGKTYYAQLRIDPLPQERADELLQVLLGDDRSVQSLRLPLIKRTEGNPFFLEESVRALVETGVLAGERGAYRLAQALPGIQVPATVQAVLAARIDRLPPDGKGLLQTAAVIGKDVPFALLQAIADLPEEVLRRELTHLQAAEFLYEATLFPELEFTFKHALTHEVAYGSLLQERRRALHARIVDAIEQLHPDRLAEQVERLAHHAFRGEMWEKAAGYLRQAGAKAFDRSANREAAACFEQALVALRHLPESRDTLEQMIDVQLDLRRALFPLGDHRRILEHLGEAERLAEGLGDERRLAHVLIYLAAVSWTLGDPERALEIGNRARAIAERLGDPALQILGNFYLGLANHQRGDYRQAIHLHGTNVALLQGDLVYERFGLPSLPSVVSRHWLAWSLGEIGEFAEAMLRGQEAVRIAEAVGQPFTLIIAYLCLGGLGLQKGDLAMAIPALQRSLGFSEASNIPLWLPSVASRLGYAYALSGRASDALPLLERAADLVTSVRLEESTVSAFLGQAYLLVGRTAEATKLGERVLKLVRARGERGNQAWDLHLLGELAARRDPPDAQKAEGQYREARVLAEELGMRPLVAHCHLGLSKLYRRTGNGKQAHEHLTTATTMYREMEMRFWLEQTEAALKELG